MISKKGKVISCLENLKANNLKISKLCGCSEAYVSQLKKQRDNFLN